jgi:hypothetical protein
MIKYYLFRYLEGEKNMFEMMRYIKCSKAYNKMRSTFVSEKGEVNVVAIVVLIGVAVVLAIIFKDAVKGLLSDLFESIGINAGDAIKTEKGK